MSRAPVVDIHRLWGPLPYGHEPGAFVRTPDTLVRTPDTALPDPAPLLHELDRLAIDTACVSHTHATHGDPRDATAVPPLPAGRLVPVPVLIPGPLGTGLPPPGTRLVRLTPAAHHWTLTGAHARALTGELTRRETAVLLPYDSATPDGLDRFARAAPRLTTVLTGTGYRSLRDLADLLDAHPHLRVETSTLAGHLQVEWLVRRYGAGRVLFGTGAPETDAAGPRYQLATLDLPEADRDRIGGGNALRLLGVQETLSARAPLTETAAVPPPLTLPRTERIVDAHGHLGRWGAFAITDGSADGLVRAMDRHGIATACVSHLLAVGPDARTGNRLLLDALAAHPGRLLGYAVHQPHDPEGPARLAELLDAPGVIGVKLHPETHRLPLDYPAYDPAFALAAERGRIVLAHSEYGSLHSDPARFAAVAARWPGVPILMGHAGLWPRGLVAAAGIAADHPHLVLEICGSRTTAHQLTRLVRTVGADRVVFGSDALFLDPRTTLGRVLFAELTGDERRAVLHGTMDRLLSGVGP
ncbi:amidohydrolase family protein [Streptomyces sp. NPDC057638]|uniref:amidohydrolase family protein n=1 Tax=Streptomyces sp. NPDC057638 TaxID=3346190 RepID=UPI00367936D9